MSITSFVCAVKVKCHSQLSHVDRKWENCGPKITIQPQSPITLIGKARLINGFWKCWSMTLPWGLETHPFSSIKRICEWEEMYSTVGVRAPIWRRTMLLNRCTTSFFPFGEQRVKNQKEQTTNVWLVQSNISYSKTEVVVFQTFPKQWYAPQNQSSVGLQWGKWGGWCCRALEPVEPLPQSEAPCLQCHTAPLSMKQGFLILPLQPTGKTVSFSRLCHRPHRDFLT